MLQKIVDLTKGAVQLEDFLDPNPPVHAKEIRRPDGSLKWILPWTLDQHRPSGDVAAGLDPQAQPPAAQSD
jgi:hypothetical protein